MAGENALFDGADPRTLSLTSHMTHWRDVYLNAEEEPSFEMGIRALRELDTLWAGKRLMRTEVLVSGQGQWTEFVTRDELAERPDIPEIIDEVDGENVLILEQGIVAVRNCVSLGFTITNFDDDNGKVPAHIFQLPGGKQQFNRGHCKTWTPTLEIKIGTLSLVPKQPLVAKIPDGLERFIQLG